MQSGIFLSKATSIRCITRNITKKMRRSGFPKYLIPNVAQTRIELVTS